ncbi:MAG: PilZ domain-containing protein [Polyangiaceae bacterium]|nr:PilZ domain-containing protein [Polyangiaceae bacterium]
MIDRRRGRRVLIRRTVQFSWDQGEASGWARDIGPQGMYVESAKQPASGAGVRMTVRFQRAPAVSIPARVCRANSEGFAVVFEKLGPNELETIRKVLGGT